MHRCIIDTMLDRKMDLETAIQSIHMLVPFAGPGIVGCHALPSQGVQSANHI
jgi:hypothetical protein